MPARNVMKYAPAIPVPVSIAGQVELTIKHAVHAQPWCQSGEGTRFAWSGAAVGDSPVVR